MKRGRLIAFPLATSAAMGWPATVMVSACEAKAPERTHLGGMEALRTPSYRVACATVTALVGKGMLGRDGPTELGRAVGRALVEA